MKVGEGSTTSFLSESSSPLQLSPLQWPRLPTPPSHRHRRVAEAGEPRRKQEMVRRREEAVRVWGGRDGGAVKCQS